MCEWRSGSWDYISKTLPHPCTLAPAALPNHLTTPLWLLIAQLHYTHVSVAFHCHNYYSVIWPDPPLHEWGYGLRDQLDSISKLVPGYSEEAATITIVIQGTVWWLYCLVYIHSSMPPLPLCQQVTHLGHGLLFHTWGVPQWVRSMWLSKPIYASICSTLPTFGALVIGLDRCPPSIPG